MGAEAGFTMIKNPLYNKIRKTEFTSCELKVVLSIYYYTLGFHRPYHKLSYSFIAKDINVSDRSVKRAVFELEKRNIIINYKKKGTKINLWGINENFGNWKNSDRDVPQEIKGNEKTSDSDRDVPIDSDRDVPIDSDRDVPQEIKNINKNYINKQNQMSDDFIELMRLFQ